MAVEPQNETPHTPPHLPCSPHACDVLRDAQPTHALRAGQSFHIPHGGLPLGTNSSSYKRSESHGALQKVASPTRTCQSDYELLADVDGVRKTLGLRPKRAAKLEDSGRDRPLNDTVTCGTDLSRAMCTAPQGFSGSRHLSNVSTPHSSPRTPPNDDDHDLRGEVWLVSVNFFFEPSRCSSGSGVMAHGERTHHWEVGFYKVDD